MAVLRWNSVLAENDHKNFNITNEECRLSENLNTNGFHSLGLKSRKYLSPNFSRNLRRFIKDNDINIITLHSLRDLWLVTPALIGLPKVRLYGFTHMLLNYKKKDWLHRLIYSRLTKLCVLTEYQKNELIKYLPVPAEKYTVIPNFIDLKKFNPEKRNHDFRSKYLRSEDGILLGCIGRIEDLKGQWELVQAFCNLAPRFPKVQLICVGEPSDKDGEYINRCKSTIANHGLDGRVFWLGFQRNVEQIFPNLDLFILPSYEETFGFVVIEAMASGVPVLGTEAGGVPEILGHGDDCFLVEPKNTKALEEKLVEILNQPSQDHQSMGQRGLSKVQKTFEKDRVYHRWMDLIGS